MSKPVNELEYLETEIIALRNRLQQSFDVLNELAEIQTKFQALAEKYQEFTHLSKDGKILINSLRQLEEKMNQQVSEIMKNLELKIEDTQNQINNLDAQAMEILQNIQEKEEDLNHKMSELDNLKIELSGILQEIKEGGFTAANFTKMDKLENQIRLSILDVQKNNKKLDGMQIFLILAVLMATISMVFPFAQYLFQQDNQNMFPTEKKSEHLIISNKQSV